MANQVSGRAAEPTSVEEVTVFSNPSQEDTVSLLGGLVRLQYWESILQDSIRAVVVFVDSGNAIKDKTAIDGLPIVGQERVALRFKDREGNQLEFQDDTAFYVNKVTPLSDDTTKSMVHLDLVPREYIMNEKVRLNKRFNGKISLGGETPNATSNKDAGGHAGKLSSQELFNVISDCCNLPIISAGGIGTKEGVRKTLSIGFSGLSIGSPFIACKEAHISEEYKEACVTYGKKDIVLTNKISGTPCTVINTPYVQEVGTKQNWIESLLSKNKRLRKWIKMLTFIKGMKTVEKAAFSSTYRTVWCAGPSIEHTKKILHVKEIVSNLINRC